MATNEHDFSSSYQNIISVQINQSPLNNSKDTKKKFNLLKVNTTVGKIENKNMQITSYSSCNNSTKKVRKQYDNNDYTEESTVFLKRRSSSRTKKVVDGLIFIPNAEIISTEDENSPLTHQQKLTVKSKSVTNYNKRRFNLTTNRGKPFSKNIPSKIDGTEKILDRVRMLKKPLLEYTVKHQEINERLNSLTKQLYNVPFSHKSDEFRDTKKSEFVSRLAHAKETSIKHLIEPGHEFATSNRTSYSDFYVLKDQEY